MPARLTDITMSRRRLIVVGSGVWLLAGSRALGAGDFWNRKPPSDWSDEEIRQLRTKSPWAKKLRVEMGGSANGPSSMDHDGSTGTFGGMHGADSNGISVSRRGAASGMGTNPGGPQAPEVTVRWESAKPMLEATGLQLPTVFENQYAISVTDLPPALLVTGMARAQASEKAMVQHLLDATTLAVKGRDPERVSMLGNAGSEDRCRGAGRAGPACVSPADVGAIIGAGLRGRRMWLAGGSVKPGFVYGATDDFGFAAAENKVHVHDLHATLLHLLGFDHTRLTFRYAGRDFRLTDVEGHVVKDILA
jgi:hypothetical protein